jgi:hypothetical protein
LFSNVYPKQKNGSRKITNTMNNFECLNLLPYIVPVGLLVIVLAVKFLLDMFLD